MPLKLKTPCNHPGCREAVHGRYCDEHAYLASYRPADQRRGTARERGYDSAWRKLRLEYVRRHPFCEDCLDDGVHNPDGIEVDHIIPIDVRPALRLEPTNLRSRCRKHHRLKSIADKGKYGDRDQHLQAERGGNSKK